MITKLICRWFGHIYVQWPKIKLCSRCGDRIITDKKTCDTLTSLCLPFKHTNDND